LARYGGEEFAVVMPGSGPEDALAAGERLRAAVEALDFDAGQGDRAALTISVGIACAGDEPVPPDSLLHAADLALYEAKRSGRNRVGLAPPVGAT
jgi:diguanylate cyclase (GGDEF)-like protein